MKVLDNISASIRNEEVYGVVVHYKVDEINHSNFGRGVQMGLEEWKFCLN